MAPLVLPRAVAHCCEMAPAKNGIDGWGRHSLDANGGPRPEAARPPPKTLGGLGGIRDRWIEWLTRWARIPGTHCPIKEDGMRGEAR